MVIGRVSTDRIEPGSSTHQAPDTPIRRCPESKAFGAFDSVRDEGLVGCCGCSIDKGIAVSHPEVVGSELGEPTCMRR